jgi:bifunctional non-homologous end joining protein LigD
LIEEREPREPEPLKRRTLPDAAASLELAAHGAFPARLAPQLATLVSSVPAGDWVTETKFDGYRMLARIDGGDVKLFTRNGYDWTEKLEPVARAVSSLGVDRAWLDGEIVVLNDNGVPDFNRLQNSIDNAKVQDIVLFVFDIPFLGDKDLRALPLLARRTVLKELLDERGNDIVRFSDSFEVQPAQLLGAACKMGLEGVMVKRADAPYVSGRTETWMKLKCQHRQEFVVVGFTDRAGGGKEVGGLLLGYYDGDRLRHAGSVGTGWDSATGAELHKMLSKIETKTSLFSADEVKPGRWSKRQAGSERWVKPSVVVEVAFAEWTPDARIRHGVFRGVRTDKPAGAIVRERPNAEVANPTPAKSSKATASSVKISNPERIIDPTTGLRKIDLVHYYESVAEWMLPYLRNRPVSLVRAPTGITGELFFQKHPESKLRGLRELDAALWPGHASLLAVDSVDALVSAAQMNVVEFHTWNSVASKIDQPDRFILDLDPGEGVTWQMLQEAAMLTRVMLTELGLDSWLKTSGGKGLHVVVPITPKLGYVEVKALSQDIVKHMSRVIPSKFVSVMGGNNRVGKIFIDYLRNGHGQTTACAFSARSRPGLGVSMPVSWEQLKDLKSGAQWTIATAREYLSFQKEDPWREYWKKKQTLAHAIRLLK